MIRKTLQSKDVWVEAKMKLESFECQPFKPLRANLTKWSNTLEKVIGFCFHFTKKDVLKNFANFIRTHLCRSLFFHKVVGLMHRHFSVNFAKYFKNAFFIEHLRITALSFCRKCYRILKSIWNIAMEKAKEINPFMHDVPKWSDTL